MGQIVSCQTEAEWLEVRKQGVGASEAAVAVGLSPWASPFDLWEQKRGLSDGVAFSERMEWGKRLEAVIAAKFSEEHEMSVYPNSYGVFRSDKYPFMQATPDYWLSGQSGLVECKTAAHEKEWQDGIPEQYMCQVQHTYAVIDVPIIWVAVLFGGNKYRDYEVPRDEAYINFLIAEEAEFWAHVLDGTPPEVEPAQMGRVAHAGEIVLPAGFWGTFLEYDVAHREFQQAEAKKDAIVDRLKTALGEAERGTLRNRSVAWSKGKNRRFIIN
jgi:putative phage-type endonuclease